MALIRLCSYLSGFEQRENISFSSLGDCQSIYVIVRTQTFWCLSNAMQLRDFHRANLEQNVAAVFQNPSEAKKKQRHLYAAHISIKSRYKTNWACKQDLVQDAAGPLLALCAVQQQVLLNELWFVVILNLLLTHIFLSGLWQLRQLREKTQKTVNC